MGTHIVIDGNAFYEVDESCLERQTGQQERAPVGERKAEKQEDTGRKCPVRAGRKRNRSSVSDARPRGML